MQKANKPGHSRPLLGLLELWSRWLQQSECQGWGWGMRWPHKAAPKGSAGAHTERCSARAGWQIVNSLLQRGKFHASDTAGGSLLHFKGQGTAWLP